MMRILPIANWRLTLKARVSDVVALGEYTTIGNWKLAILEDHDSLNVSGRVDVFDQCALDRIERVVAVCD